MIENILRVPDDRLFIGARRGIFRERAWQEVREQRMPLETQNDGRGTVRGTGNQEKIASRGTLHTFLCMRTYRAAVWLGHLLCRGGGGGREDILGGVEQCTLLCT